MLMVEDHDFTPFELSPRSGWTYRNFTAWFDKNNNKLITRWDSERELFYGDIMHVLQIQNTELAVQRSESLQKKLSW